MMYMQQVMQNGMTLKMEPDHFNLHLPDGTLLNVEQTQDDFSIVRGNGIAAYTKATSALAIEGDGDPTPEEQTTGFN